MVVPHSVLRGSVPVTYYIDQLMDYRGKSYYICMLSAAELLDAAHQRPQQFWIFDKEIEKIDFALSIKVLYYSKKC